MDRSNVIQLIKIESVDDELGQKIPVEVPRDVFCDIASVSGRENLEAGKIGLKPEYKITMFLYDYEGEKIVKLKGTKYSVYRTYLGKSETIELYLEKKAGL